MIGDRTYPIHIRDAIAKIEIYSSVGKGRFFTETHWHDAVIRQLEIIGEATKNLSEEIRSQHSDIPWKRIAGQRDILIHNYMGVDLNAVWAVTRKDLPNLKSRVEEILETLSESE